VHHGPGKQRPPGACGRLARAAVFARHSPHHSCEPFSPKRSPAWVVRSTRKLFSPLGVLKSDVRFRSWDYFPCRISPQAFDYPRVAVRVRNWNGFHWEGQYVTRIMHTARRMNVGLWKTVVWPRIVIEPRDCRPASCGLHISLRNHAFGVASRQEFERGPGRGFRSVLRFSGSRFCWSFQ